MKYFTALLVLLVLAMAHTSEALSMSEVAGYWKRGGGSSSSCPTAVAVAWAESHGNPRARGNNPGSYDRGLWQINSKWHPDVSDSCAYDAACNAKNAVRISSGGSRWSPWATYNHGKHNQYMSQARSACSSSRDEDDSAGLSIPDSGSKTWGDSPSDPNGQLSTSWSGLSAMLKDLFGREPKKTEANVYDADENMMDQDGFISSCRYGLYRTRMGTVMCRPYDEAKAEDLKKALAYRYETGRKYNSGKRRLVDPYVKIGFTAKWDDDDSAGLSIPDSGSKTWGTPQGKFGQGHVNWSGLSNLFKDEDEDAEDLKKALAYRYETGRKYNSGKRRLVDPYVKIGFTAKWDDDDSVGLSIPDKFFAFSGMRMCSPSCVTPSCLACHARNREILKFRKAQFDEDDDALGGQWMHWTV